MYLHVGDELVVTTSSIVGIFDMDNTTVSRLGRRFLPEAQNKGVIINATEDLPKSYVVTSEKDKEGVYISSYSTKALSRHTRVWNENKQSD